MLYAFQKCEHFLFSSTGLIFIKLSNVSGLFGAPCSFSSPLLYKKFLDYANKLLIGFVQHFADYYGDNMVVYNVHSLIHLVDDVKHYGPMDQFSTFLFESFLGRLKKLVRKKHQTLPQIVRRLGESRKLGVKQNFPNTKSVSFKHRHSLGPLPFSCKSHSQFTCVQNNDLCFSVYESDNCVQIKKHVCLIKNIICDECGNIKIVYSCFKKAQPFFTSPLSSVALDIYVVSNESSNIHVCSLADITCKYVRLPWKDEFVVVVPLVQWFSNWGL